MEAITRAKMPIVLSASPNSLITMRVWNHQGRLPFSTHSFAVVLRMSLSQCFQVHLTGEEVMVIVADAAGYDPFTARHRPTCASRGTSRHLVISPICRHSAGNTSSLTVVITGLIATPRSVQFRPLRTWAHAVPEAA